MTILTKIETRQPTPIVGKPRAQPPITPSAIPPLENGDRLSRAEFERRYKADPEIKKAELIEGVVYVASPVRVRRHGIPHSDIISWLGWYRAATRGVYVADNSTLQLDLDNEPQPDVAIWIEGGNAYINAEDYLEGAPELIVEVAGSSASIDLGDKLTTYRRNGVQEYLVLLTHEREVRWFSWRTGEAEEILPDEGGILRSLVLPGLQLHPGLFWQGDMAGVLDVLQQGLATAEHAAFVQRLQE
jgi:Uma2 family endonuclease